MKTRTEPLHTSEGDVLVVEYHERAKGKWSPFSIVTEHDTWDACWSRCFECTLVHQSGSGCRGEHNVAAYCHTRPPPCRIWMAGGIVPVRYHGRLMRDLPVAPVELLGMGYERIPAPMGDPFADCIHVDGHIEYCSICDDHFPDDQLVCGHLRWSDHDCATVGTGATDDDSLRYVSISMPHVMRKLGWIRTLKLADYVRAGCPKQYPNPLADALDFLDDVDVYERPMESAYRWLSTLGRGKRLAEARIKTLEMLAP